eukprot:10424365-Ditylum_brightwellii.AAC.1
MVKNGVEGQLDEDVSMKLKDHFPNAKEILDSEAPEEIFDKFAITAYVDSNHVHDKMARRFITSLIIVVGRMPMLCMAKYQDAVKKSTYDTKFMTVKTAIEEVMSVQYMLRCLGVKVSKASH